MTPRPVSCTLRTRFVPITPGGSGSIMFVDDDGTVDVNVRDRDGQGWFWYRSRSGKHSVPVYEADVLQRVEKGEDVYHPVGKFSYKPHGVRADLGFELQNTGILQSIQLNKPDLMAFQQWHAYVLEPDVLVGRRGTAGWNGQDNDRGLWVPALKPPGSDWWDLVRDIDWSSPVTWGIAIVGVVLTILSIGFAFYLGALVSAALVATLGAGAAVFIGTVVAFTLAGVASGAIMQATITGMATHDLERSLKAAGHGAVVGGIAGLAAGLTAGLLTVLSPAYGAALIGDLGVVALAGAAFPPAFAGGFAAGVYEARRAGKGWGESLTTGIKAGLISGVVASVLAPVFYGIGKLSSGALRWARARWAARTGSTNAAPKTGTGDSNALVPETPENPSAYSAAYETELDPSVFGSSRKVHFNRANAALDKAMQADPRLAELMDELIPGVRESVSSVGGRKTPMGWTWEHASSSTAGGRMGVMRLVPTYQHTPGSPWWRVIHPDFSATGGYAEWAIPAGAPPN
jgi:hypothetical protein